MALFGRAAPVEFNWLEAEGITKDEFLAHYAGGLRDLIESRAASERWLDHTGGNVLVWDKLRKVFPDAQFVLIVRDGRNVVESVMHTFWGGSFSFRKAAEMWVEHNEAGIAALAGASAEHGCLVTYESLIAAPDERMKAILGFLGLQWADDVLAPYTEEPLVNSSFPEDTIADKLTSRWHHWDSWRHREFEEIGGAMLRHSGMSKTRPGRSSPTQPRILVATPGEIAYDTNAGHARLWSIVQALAASGAEIGYFGLWPLAHRRYADAMAERGMHVVGERPPRHDLADAARHREDRHATERRFAAAIHAFEPTHIYLYLHFTAIELLDVARSAAPTAALLLDAVDVLFRQDWAAPNGPPIADAAELAMYARCAVIVDSHTDAATLRSRQLGTPVIVAPLTYEPRPGPSWAHRRGLLFAGTSDHPPNVDAIRWFVNDVLPAVREHLAVPTTIVGSDRPRRGHQTHRQSAPQSRRPFSLPVQGCSAPSG